MRRPILLGSASWQTGPIPRGFLTISSATETVMALWISPCATAFAVMPLVAHARVNPFVIVALRQPCKRLWDVAESMRIGGRWGDILEIATGLSDWCLDSMTKAYFCVGHEMRSLLAVH